MKSKVINLFGDKAYSQNQDVKYAKLLEQFLEPFDSDFEDTEYYEDVMELAIAAWNFGNMKMLLPESESDDAINSMVDEDVDIELLTRMIALKIKTYKEFTNFIVDFNLEESNEGPVLTVTTQEQDAYLTALTEVLEGDHSDFDFDENYIDRSAITIKPLQPFLDWFADLYPGEDDGLTASMIYLISADIDDVDAWLKKHFDRLFTRELEGWHTNDKEWPQKRTYTMFKQWFQVEVSSMVYDLEKEPVFKEG